MTDNPLADIRDLVASGIPQKQAETFIQILWEVRSTAKANGVYNAIAAMRRLESCGFTRQQAETLAPGLLDIFAAARPLSAVR